ncbi:MAG: polyprenyl synthetase family protein [Flavobacteriaceae bacterium]
MNLSDYKKEFLTYLNKEIQIKEPKNLYEPIHYILQIGGKRLRPILTLVSAHFFNGDYKKALPAALAIEVFHNFTLVHDDIMDEAPIRRGKTTVHKKWNLNTGILSGDAMMLHTNQLMEAYDDEFKELMVLFNKTALEVCEGQQYDVDFETRTDVTINEYIKMITYKTAVLVACSLKMGAIIAGANKVDANSIYYYGLNLGIAFQLQDDYLDTFGDQATFGKLIGGDILENKKTFLYLKLLKVISEDDKKILLNYFSTTEKSDKKINTVTLLYSKYKIPALVKEEITYYTKRSYKNLGDSSITEDGKLFFTKLGDELLNRTV